MVFGIVSSLAGLIKVRYLTDKAIIDNCISQLHYKFTAAIFFLACLLCTATSYIGNPIECIADNEKIQNVVNTYCWIASKYTLPESYRNSVAGKHVSSAGVGNDVNGHKVEHDYYQWVPFMLFFQGVLFYAPHWFWKNWEDGKVGKITDGLRGTVADTIEERKSRQTKLVEYIIASMSLHNWYATGYFLCEVFNFVNVIANIYLCDKFLGGKFLTYGIKAATDNNSTFSIYEEIFPRMVKCKFYMFGPSGSIVHHDHLCVLALNIINDKIYLFLWWWFIVLAILSGLTLMYSTAIILSTSVRRLVLFRRFKYKISDGCHTIVNHLRVGDFFLLHLLGQNINMTVFEEVLEELGAKLQSHMPNAPSSFGNMETLPIYPKKDSFLPQ